MLLNLMESTADLAILEQARIIVSRSVHLDLDQPLRAALEPTLQSASICAGKVRDRFSIDGWTALSDLTSSLASKTQIIVNFGNGAYS